MFSEFFSGWANEYGLECTRALFLDASAQNTFEAMAIVSDTIRFAQKHQRFTALDLRNHLSSAGGTFDVPVTLALAALVEVSVLAGPNPYAHEPTGPLDELVYRLPVYSAFPLVDTTGCEPPEEWFARLDSAVGPDPCADCTLVCDDDGPYCPF